MKYFKKISYSDASMEAKIVNGFLRAEPTTVNVIILY